MGFLIRISQKQERGRAQLKREDKLAKDRALMRLVTDSIRGLGVSCRRSWEKGREILKVRR